MRRVLIGGCVLGLIAVGRLDAQTVRLGVQGVLMTHDEVKKEKRADGNGVGGVLELHIGRVRLEAKGYQATLSPWLATDTVDFKARQVDVRVSYEVATGVALEVGGGRRWIDPQFAAQDVGFIRVGALSYNEVSRLAALWVRGAYLVRSQFIGGGDTGLAVELGLGAAVGTANGRVRVRAEYEFQRIDRRVWPNDVETQVPVQVQLARFGVEVGF